MIDEATAGERLDATVKSITNIPGRMADWVSSFRTPKVTFRGLSRSQMRILHDQDLGNLKIILAKVGKGNDWYDLNSNLEFFVKHSSKFAINDGKRVIKPWELYFDKLAEIQIDLIDDLSASVAREYKDDIHGYKMKRSYYLNRSAHANYNVYFEAIDGLHQRVQKLFGYIPKPKQTEYWTHYKTSMKLLQRAFEESGLHLNLDNNYNLLDWDDHHDNMTSKLHTMRREMGTEILPPDIDDRLKNSLRQQRNSTYDLLGGLPPLKAGGRKGPLPPPLPPKK